MKTLFKTTAETPKTSTWVIIISLLTSVSDFAFNVSGAIGWSEHTVTIIGTSISFVVTVLNILINNGVIKSVDEYAKELLNKILK